jgi:uncharacterized protein
VIFRPVLGRNSESRPGGAIHPDCGSVEKRCSLIEVATILVFAVLQSIFGIGLLFFGTPTLLLLGYPFVDTLAVLLPASIAVSLFQVAGGKLPDAERIRSTAIWCLIPLAVVLVGSIGLGWDVKLDLFVAIILLAYVPIRVSSRMMEPFRDSVRRLPKLWLIVIGVVHGLSNLGGGLLGIFAANSLADRLAIRSYIAFCYLCFAAIQLTALAILTPHVMYLGQFGYAALAAGVFVIVERRLFGSISAPAFESLFTVLIGCYSALLFLKQTGVFNSAMPS